MSRASWSLWTDLAAAGGRRVGPLQVVGGSYSEKLDNTDKCELRALVSSRVSPSVRQVVRVDAPNSRIFEYRVSSLGRTLKNGVRSLTGISPLQDLTTAGLVRIVTNGVTSYALGGRYTAGQFVSQIVLTNLAADGVSHWAIGTVDTTGIKELYAPASGWTRLQWLTNIADLFGLELRAVRYSETQYRINLVARTGASAATVVIRRGKNLLDLQQTTDSTELASAITPTGMTVSGWTAPASLGENLWTLGTIPGSAPYWIPLTDPDGGASPIAIDDECIGCKLLLNDGTLLSITDSRASDSSVLVSATTGLVAGERVQIVADSSATRLTELSTPGAARLHRTDPVSTLRGEGNLIQNGTLVSFASESSVTSFASTNGRRYPRNDYTTLTLTATSNVPNLTAVTVNGTPSARLYLNEYFDITGSVTLTVRLTASVQLDSSGNGTLSLVDLVGSTATAITTGDVLTMAPTRNTRPASFTSDDGFTNDTLRLDSSGSGCLTKSWRVKYLAGLPYVNVAVGLTETNRSGSSILAANCMSADIRNTGAGSTLASATAASDLANGALRHSIITANALLSADTTLAVRVNPIGVPSCGSFLRWIMLWLSPSPAATPPPIDGSHANVLWQRANRALLARSLQTLQLTISAVDLSTIAGYSITREQVTLGGKISVPESNVTPRAIGITYDALVAPKFSLQIDSQPTRLSTFLAERL